ncbi:uncharacterized protein [Halyomorpha halys]|uniref:uncharacterized protein n=1 Tax=Halyomorpha halys TaxID=286706 RepID=UPI0006D4D9ED|nr:solute carrier family 2, facilitated glucose transporter member 6 isoform X1 [Halyomorpha halys]XP_024214703.1 solute carrier family 2, facilitated glucose transporter member 6 isoform X1 [Halyomorpha halys]
MAHQLSTSAQVRSCLVASGGLLSSGMTVAFPSIYKEQRLTTEMSWLGSASHFAMIGGSLIVGPMMDSLGRKIGLVLALSFSMIGWSFIGGSGWLVPGRLLTGLSAGIVSAPVSVLVAEISAPKLRAHLTVYKHAAFSLGLFIMYCFGLFFKDQWKLSSLICGGMSLLSLVTVWAWVPETRKGKTNMSYGPFFAALPRRKDVSRPFLLMAGLASLKQLSGTTVVLSYASQLLVAGGQTQGELGAVCIGGVRLAASLFAGPLAARFGRRSLATLGGYLSSLALLIMAGGSSQSLACLLVFVFSSALSSSAIQALVGEVFPVDFRAVCTGLTTTATYVSAFAALHSHPWLLSSLGLNRLLGIYATIAVITTLIVICFLHDTTVTVKEVELGQPDAEEVMEPLKEETKEMTVLDELKQNC